MKQRNNVDGSLGKDIVRRCLISSISVIAGVVKDWLSNAPEEETNANSTWEEHREPGDVIILRQVGVFSKFQVRIFTAVECQHKQGTQIL